MKTSLCVNNQKSYPLTEGVSCDAVLVSAVPFCSVSGESGAECVSPLSLLSNTILRVASSKTYKSECVLINCNRTQTQSITAGLIGQKDQCNRNAEDRVTCLLLVGQKLHHQGDNYTQRFFSKSLIYLFV